MTEPMFAGDFGNDAPLLTHHTPAWISGDARQLVEEWLGRERIGLASN